MGVFEELCSSPSRVHFCFLAIKSPIGVQSTDSPLFWHKFVYDKISPAPPLCCATLVKSKTKKVDIPIDFPIASYTDALNDNKSFCIVVIFWLNS